MDHHAAREILRTAVVATEPVKRLGQPPPPDLERRSSGAVHGAIAICEFALEQGRDVAPVTPLGVRHVGESRREHAVGSGKVTADVPHQTAQHFAPPRDGATL